MHGNHCTHSHGLHIHAHPQDGHRHHAHHHVPPSGFDKRFAIGAAINLGFVAGELSFGFLSNSLGLIADAAHNFSDVIGLLLAWGGVWLTRFNPTEKHTYGYSGASILAALGNAALLLIAIGGIIVQAVNRFMHPAAVHSETIIYVALVGIVINGATAMLFYKDQHHDINVRGAYLHMLADAGISLGVVVAGLIIAKTGWLWIDPTVSLMIAGVILIGTWGLAKEALHLSMAGVPPHIDRNGVYNYLSSLPGVTEVHDLHIWAMSTTKTALTVHLLRPEGGIDDDFLHEIAAVLEKDFNIQHPTIQLEKGDKDGFCRFAPAEVI
jgi:cobalt-zinc-cadmium efflux system protein